MNYFASLRVVPLVLSSLRSRHILHYLTLPSINHSQGLRSYETPIPPAFPGLVTWNGPLYSSPDIITQIELRKLPDNATVGLPTPMKIDLFDDQLDALGNLPWEKMLSPTQIARRKKTIFEQNRPKEIKPWDQLTFAERKIELKKRAKLKEQMKIVRNFDESESDDDGDGNMPEGFGGGDSSIRSRKQSVLAPLRNLRNPYEKHRKGQDAGGDRPSFQAQKRRGRKSETWEEVSVRKERMTMRSGRWKRATRNSNYRR